MQPKKVVMVTGASRGIGAAVCYALAKVGSSVVLISRTQSAVHDASHEVERLGGKALALAFDISVGNQCEMAVEKALSVFGRIDALVNNAGVLEPISSISSTDPNAWRYNIEVNLIGPFFMTRAAIPALRKTKGRIINVSTGAAVQPIFGWSAYCASKAGLTHFTRVLAMEETDICSLALRPGVVDTRMQELIRTRGRGVMPPKILNYFNELKTGEKLEDPSVPARSIAWLALEAPFTWSGEFLDYDRPDIREAARTYF
jgi:NAD(P)-dependent dehydrogenase (short-subunit alcohol dehydrogenase family)